MACAGIGIFGAGMQAETELRILIHFNMKTKTIALIAALAAAAACTQKEDPAQVRNVNVEPSEVTVTAGTTKTLQFEVQPSTAVYEEVVWSADDPKVAKVSRKGLLTAVAEGQTVVRVTVGGVSGECHVSVVASTVPVTGVTLEPAEATIGIGEILELYASVTPEDAGLKTVTWLSSDKTVATVSDGVVTGVKAGEATVTATTDDGGFEASCKVKVIDNNVTAVSFAGASDNAKVVDMNSSETIAVNYVPKTARNKDLEWISSDGSIAKAESAGEGLGKVTFLDRSGAVVITAVSKADPSVRTSQSYFVKGEAPLYTVGAQTVYAGKKTEYSFNIDKYPGVTSVKWIYDGKEENGVKVNLAVDKAVENTVTMAAAFGDVVVEESFAVVAEEWYMDVDIPEELGGYNTVPVFSPDGGKAYVILSGAKRALLEIRLDERKLGWKYDFPSSETAANNGGHIAVNPKTGDIICPTSSRIYCITPSGDLKWKSEQLETNVGRNPTMYSGCGAGFSNDCSVVFMCATPRGLFALDMNDGHVIDSVRSWNDGTNNPESNQVQFGVYGDDNICMHLKNIYIVFHHFDGSKFSELGRVNTIVAEKYVTDLSSCAITSDQKTAYFSGYSVFSVDLAERKTVAGIQDGNKWHNSPSITEDGHMYQAQGGYMGANAAILYYEAKQNLTAGTCVYKNGIAGDDGMKFGSVPCDREGNGYFCFWDKSEGNIAFYKSEKGGQAECIAKTTDKTNAGGAGFYQGSFNFNDGYLVATTGGVSGSSFAGKVLVRCIDAERARSWSGHGGDKCSTKNANLVYADRQ